MKCHRASSLFSDRPGAVRGDIRTALSILTAASSTDPASAAQRYLTLGFSVIPLKGKVPVVTWRAYQRRRPTQAELLRWARRGLFQNVGIVCGEVSGDLVVLDFDAPGAYNAFRARFPDLARTYTVATGGGGWHVYLRVDALPPSRRGQGVELCAEGRQVVAPPSIHPGTGQLYRVHLLLDIQHVPDLDCVVEWAQSAPAPVQTVQPDTDRKHTAGSRAITPALLTAIADHFRMQDYRQKGDWLNGPCIYPERHAHHDYHRSFGFNTRTGYGYCFVCGSMLAKDIARLIGIDPASSGGVIASTKEKAL